MIESLELPRDVLEGRGLKPAVPLDAEANLVCVALEFLWVARSSHLSLGCCEVVAPCWGVAKATPQLSAITKQLPGSRYLLRGDQRHPGA